MTSAQTTLVVVSCFVGIYVFLLALQVYADTIMPLDYLEKRLKAQGMTLISCKRRLWFQGPFFFCNCIPRKWGPPVRVVFRVRVRDDAGGERQGWAKCTANSLSDQGELELIWDSD